MEIKTSSVPAPIQPPPPPPVMRRVHTLTLTDTELAWVTACIGMCPFTELQRWYATHAATVEPIARAHIHYAELRRLCKEHGLTK